MLGNAFARFALVSLPLITLACGGSGAPDTGNETPGTVSAHPDGSGFFFFADPNERGFASQLHLADLRWGRLVDVFGLDSQGERVLMQPAFLIGGSLTGDGTNLALETSSITGQQSLIVLRDVTDDAPGGGRDQFFDTLRSIDTNLPLLPDAGLGGAGLFSMVPRNATIMLRFDDLIDPNTVDSHTVRVLTGVPTGVPFEARILIDRNHGGTHDRNGDGVPEFFSTRVYVDPTVSEFEAFAGGVAAPINSTGFPASSDTDHSNVAIRVPTRIYPVGGQTRVLQNLTAHALSTTDNGTIDFASPTEDVTRVARSGGLQVVTGDPFNGFLPDDAAPRVIGSLNGFIDMPPQQINPQGDGLEFVLPSVSFVSTFCSQALSVGDILQQDSVIAEVIQPSMPPIDGVVYEVRVRLRVFPPSFSEPADWILTGVGAATLLSPYDPLANAGQEACFVQVSPTPTGAPEAPARGVSRNSTFSVRFSEAMERSSLSAFEGLRLTRVLAPATSSDWTIGEVDASIDLLEFSFLPMVPLDHVFGQAESYFLSVSTDGQPPADLVGNPLAAGLPAIEFALDPGEATSRNGGRVLRFDRVDEDAPFGDVGAGAEPLPEFFGQHSYDLARGMLRPRPVTRFEAVVDRTQPAGRHQTMLLGGLQEPLSPLGSKLQMTWRSIDAAYELGDPTFYNVDVEGLNWTPAGLPATDHFDNFEIRLAHARYLPDEYICATLLYPGSGLRTGFEENLLSALEDPQQVLHPRSSGYSIQPGDMFSASSGTQMMPFPMNRGVAPEDVRTYTWRDTALRTRGGDPLSGAPTYTELNSRETPFDGCTAILDDVDLVYPLPSTTLEPVNVRSIALPLLIELRCFPDDGASGLNAFDVSIAQVFSPDPAFRAHSTGGVLANGDVRRIDPDLEATARGGLDSTSTPAGQPTRATDNIIYSGSMDLVVRVSRSHSVWFLANDPANPDLPFANPNFAAPVVEPRAEDQPAGTELKLAFRGATAVGASESSSAALLDAYGDHYETQFHSVDSANTNVAFTGGDDSWREPQPGGPNPLGIDGARYYQVRLSFLSNILSGATPELSSLAVSWHD